jgi:hypothetical protein
MMRLVRSSSSGHTALNFRANTELELIGRDHITSTSNCYLYLLTPPYTRFLLNSFNNGLQWNTEKVASKWLVFVNLKYE